MRLDIDCFVVWQSSWVGRLEDCGWDWDRSPFVGWLDCWEVDGEGRCEAGCNLDFMKGCADGCLRAHTADSGENWFRVWLLGHG